MSPVYSIPSSRQFYISIRTFEITREDPLDKFNVLAMVATVPALPNHSVLGGIPNASMKKEAIASRQAFWDVLLWILVPRNLSGDTVGVRVGVGVVVLLLFVFETKWDGLFFLGWESIFLLGTFLKLLF